MERMENIIKNQFKKDFDYFLKKSSKPLSEFDYQDPLYIACKTHNLSEEIVEEGYWEGGINYQESYVTHKLSEENSKEQFYIIVYISRFRESSLEDWEYTFMEYSFAKEIIEGKTKLYVEVD